MVKKTRKQVIKEIEYQTPHERISCYNCINYVHDITIKSHRDIQKCLKYGISVSSFAICSKFKQQN